MPAGRNQDEWTDDEEEPLPHAQAWEVGRRLVLPRDEYPDAPCTELDGRGWEVEVMKYNRREAKVRVRFVHATDEDGRRYAPMWLMATHLRELPEPEWEQDGEDPYSGWWDNMCDDDEGVDTRPGAEEEEVDDERKFGDSPHRRHIRKEAHVAMLKQAKKMQERARKKDKCHVTIDVGTVVQLAAADVDRAKTDVYNITGVVVEQVSMEGVLHYRVGAKPGVLKGVYARHQLKPLFDTPPSILGLHEILSTWEDAPRVGERRCMRVVSHTGGQGFLKCSCTGSCTTKRCACFKNKRICNSRCHKGNTRCANCHKDRD